MRSRAPRVVARVADSAQPVEQYSMKQKQLILIGLTVLTAIFAIVVALLFLNPTPGDGKNIIKVRFQNIEKISPGTRVTFAGKAVGVVKRIVLLDGGAISRTPTDSAGIYPYELVLQVDSSVRVFPQDEIVTHTAGLMGEKTIAIIPMPLRGAPQPPVGPDTIIYSKDASSVENTMDTLSDVVKKADLTIDKVFATIDKSQENLTSAANSLNKAARQLDTFMTTLNNDEVAARISTLTQAATNCCENYSTLAKTALKGHNSLSRLLADDSFLLELDKTIDKTNDLLDAILEYGFLFHTNSNYQRTFIQEHNQPIELEETVEKAKKMLLEAKRNLLDSPDASKHEGLIEDINNALFSLSSHKTQNTSGAL